MHLFDESKIFIHTTQHRDNKIINKKKKCYFRLTETVCAVAPTLSCHTKQKINKIPEGYFLIVSQVGGTISKFRIFCLQLTASRNECYVLFSAEF